MTTKIEISEGDSLDLELVVPDDDGPFDLSVDVDQVDTGDGWAKNSVTLKITAGDDKVVTVKVGQFHEHLSMLATELESAANQARRLLEQWEDQPDEFDAFVNEDRSSYTIQIEGVQMGDPKGYPREDIAIYELAAAMTESGIFPACWYVNERGNIHSIDKEVREYHDEGGTGLKPLPGVVFDEDAAVRANGWKAYVVKDWGDMGVSYVLSGDDQVHFTEDHDELTPYDEDED